MGRSRVAAHHPFIVAVYGPMYRCINYPGGLYTAYNIVVNPPVSMQKLLVKFEILDQSDRIGAKSPTFDLFSLVAPQSYDLAKKSSINTNRQFTRRFPMSPRWTSYVVSKPPRVAQKRKMSKI